MGRSILASSFVLLALSAASARPTETIPEDHGRITRLDGTTILEREADAQIVKMLAAAHVTGAGVAVFRDGRPAYLKAFGQRDKDKGLPLTPDSVMTSASLSKAAFAVMVMRMVERGELDLDKPVYLYLPKPLPEYPRYSDLRGDDRYRKITLRILLSHSSGFANWRFFDDDRKLKIHFEPGARFAYSGEGIDLAQFVVETVTKQSLQDLMDREVFKPLGMSRTSMVWEARFQDDVAERYDEYGRTLERDKRSKPDAAGSMQTTLRDYATLLSAVMKRQVLGEKTTTEMLRHQIAIHSAHQFPSLATQATAANDGIQLGYGLGWGEYSTGYGKAFFKEGHDDGWRHLGLCFDQKGSGILIMTNSSNGEGVFKPILDLLLGESSFPFEWESYTPYTSIPPPPPLRQHTRVSLTSEQLKKFAGKYALSPQVILTVTEESGRLFVQENDEPKQELLASGPLDFYSATSSDECSFGPAEGSRVGEMILHADGREIRLKRMK